jgi:hypothetical protein
VEWDIVIKEGFFISEGGIPRETEIQLNGAHQAQFHIKSKGKQHKKDRTISNTKLY